MCITWQKSIVGNREIYHLFSYKFTCGHLHILQSSLSPISPLLFSSTFQNSLIQVRESPEATSIRYPVFQIFISNGIYFLVGRYRRRTPLAYTSRYRQLPTFFFLPTSIYMYSDEGPFNMNICFSFSTRAGSATSLVSFSTSIFSTHTIQALGFQFFLCTQSIIPKLSPHPP